MVWTKSPQSIGSDATIAAQIAEGAGRITPGTFSPRSYSTMNTSPPVSGPPGFEPEDDFNAGAKTSATSKPDAVVATRYTSNSNWR